MNIETVVFDLGGVLVDWNPRYLYRKLLKSEVEIEAFLRDVCNGHWNERQDEGRPFAEGIKELSAQHPGKSDLIQAYFSRWPEMLGGPIHGTVEILKEIHGARKHGLFALSNWSSETFPFALERFDFLKLFETILLSGRERLIKPDPKFYGLLVERHGVRLEHAVFIDDVDKNVNAARSLGMHAIKFTSPEQLRSELAHMGIL